MTQPDNLNAVLTRIQRLAAIVGVVGLALLIFGALTDKTQFFQSYLFAFIFWNGLTIGSLAIFLLHSVVGGNWGAVIRRFIEAGARTLPLNFVLLLPILIFGIPVLYYWAQPASANDVNIAFKRAWLNVPFFILRSVVYFLIWGFYAYRLSMLSRRQDQEKDPTLVLAKFKRISPFGLLLIVLSATFAFFDWIMSLEPHWFSTIYGAMFLVGQVLETFAFCILLLTWMSNRRPFKDVVNRQHYHDLGNLMLAFTMLWAYTSLSQFLIIWAGNLPEEIPWYIRRFSGGWGWLAWFIGVFHFCVPFVLLLMRFIKRNPRLLYWVALYMFGVRMVDVFWIVEPALRPRFFYLSWMDIVAPIAVGGLWLTFFLWHLKSRPLLPVYDPRLGHRPLETEAELTA